MRHNEIKQNIELLQGTKTKLHYHCHLKLNNQTPTACKTNHKQIRTMRLSSWVWSDGHDLSYVSFRNRQRKTTTNLITGSQYQIRFRTDSLPNSLFKWLLILRLLDDSISTSNVMRNGEKKLFASGWGFRKRKLWSLPVHNNNNRNDRVKET
jgi:hypothetical protein